MRAQFVVHRVRGAKEEVALQVNDEDGGTLGVEERAKEEFKHQVLHQPSDVVAVAAATEAMSAVAAARNGLRRKRDGV